jgi:hypothetical protein
MALHGDSVLRKPCWGRGFSQKRTGLKPRLHRTPTGSASVAWSRTTRLVMAGERRWDLPPISRCGSMDGALRISKPPDVVGENIRSRDEANGVKNSPEFQGIRRNANSPRTLTIGLQENGTHRHRRNRLHGHESHRIPILIVTLTINTFHQMTYNFGPLFLVAHETPPATRMATRISGNPRIFSKLA